METGATDAVGADASGVGASGTAVAAGADKTAMDNAVSMAEQNHVAAANVQTTGTNPQPVPNNNQTTQYQVSAGGTAAVLLGLGGDVSLGISVPKDWKDIGGYQIYGSAQAQGMMGLGAYLGVGGTVGRYRSDGSLPILSTDSGWYAELDAGNGPSVSVSAQGHIGDGKTTLPTISGEGFSPLPKVGEGYGLYGGVGPFGSVTLATPTPRDAYNFLGSAYRELIGVRPAY